MAVSTSTQVCNLACNRVPTARITSLADGTVQAGLCAIEYPQALAELLEATDWNMSSIRQALAETTNERESEWAYAYARPDNCAMMVRVVLPADANATSLTAGQVPSAFDQIPQLAVPFADYGNVIYTNAEDAIAEFVTTTAVSTWPALFVAALAAMIAARICLPITKDEKRKQLRDREAQFALMTALAANANKNHGTYGDDFIPEAVLARQGYGSL